MNTNVNAAGNSYIWKWSKWNSFLW